MYSGSYAYESLTISCTCSRRSALSSACKVSVGVGKSAMDRSKRTRRKKSEGEIDGSERVELRIQKAERNLMRGGVYGEEESTEGRNLL